MLPMQDALTQQNCITELSTLGLLSIHGSDAKSFLQGQITCNLNNITPNKSLLGAHCNLKGRMQSLFRIFNDPHDKTSMHYYLTMPTSMLTIAQQNFKKFAMFSKIQIDIATAFSGIGLYGPNAMSLVENLLGGSFLLEQDYSCVSKVTNNEAFHITRLPGQDPRFEIWGKIEIIKQLWQTFLPNCKPISPSAWELLDIQSGIPTIYPTTVDLILPHHANLSMLNGISFDKGCYLGQEVIARMQYRGKIKKHLYRAFVQECDKAPWPGAEILSEPFSANEAPGIVVRSSETSASSYELLVVLDEQYQNFENVRLYLADGPKVHRLDLPYSF